MIDGIILAAGYSSRFTQNKMCALYLNKPLILHTIENMHSVCEKIYLVTGHYHQEIVEIVKGIKDVEVVYNENYDQGMFSSVLTGVSRVSHDFFIIPGDYPLVKKTVYQEILKGASELRVPSYKGRLGHPLFMKKTLINNLLKTEATNLKEFRNFYPYQIIEVSDESILLDIDTIDDLLSLEGKE
jgi:molybdenum cofactor cytidylyltransferase